ncbi:uncharacterized protein F5891DRAFT_92682 [Suillus fuscotomentosus]|uniref:Uncharacterized protein n=1 Tax=Suillus fuscotomentosus TaxID=1912939 RepID=A0AAD4EBI2_9AGAM|nr:uncharacterized protein F5891DRAFT_92682 [Suillus fuscotomentosus]KAG1903234.1 hypothetical protein F5891DRAFT_92682 [Suillus fuscotomentosus]
MDSFDSFSEPSDLLEGFEYRYMSVSAYQSAGSHGGFVPTGDSDHLVTVPFESRSRIVVDGLVWPTHILHAPQPSRPLVYPWSGSMYTGFYSTNNQIIGMNIPRPSAPIPALQMRDDLLANFHDISDNLPLRLPRGTSRFEPYHNDRSHKYHDAFICQWDNEGALCGDELQATPKDIFAHLRQDHGIGVSNKGTYRCLWITAYGRCEDRLKFQSFGRHIIKHAGIRFKCSLCDMTMPARNDLATQHRHHHPNCSQADFFVIQSQASF